MNSSRFGLDTFNIHSLLRSPPIPDNKVDESVSLQNDEKNSRLDIFSPTHSDISISLPYRNHQHTASLVTSQPIAIAGPVHVPQMSLPLPNSLNHINRFYPEVRPALTRYRQKKARKLTMSNFNRKIKFNGTLKRDVKGRFASSKLSTGGKNEKQEITTNIGNTVTQSNHVACQFKIPKINFNQLVFKKMLGKGGFGSVYEGTCKFNANEAPVSVAIKSFNVCKYFNSEYQIMEKMQAIPVQGTVKCLGYLHENSRHFLVMQLGGKDLHKSIAQENLHWRICFMYAIQIAETLRNMHQYNFVHCDIKPSNILLDAKDPKQSKAILADFGFTVQLQSKYLIKKQVHGSQFYCAPEAAKKIVCTESDIYSFGTLLFKIFAASEKMSRYIDPELDNFLNYVSDYIKNYKSDIEAECAYSLAKLIRWCWQKVPSNRPSAESVHDALLNIRDNREAKYN